MSLSAQRRTSSRSSEPLGCGADVGGAGRFADHDGHLAHVQRGEAGQGRGRGATRAEDEAGGVGFRPVAACRAERADHAGHVGAVGLPAAVRAQQRVRGADRGGAFGDHVGHGQRGTFAGHGDGVADPDRIGPATRPGSVSASHSMRSNVQPVRPSAW